MGSYIKIDRKILEWGWYKDEHTKSLFLHCLLKANWKDGCFKNLVIKRGQFVTSIPKLGVELELTSNEVRTAIKHLKSTGEITVRNYSKFSVFTVVNYDSYQAESQPKSQTNHSLLTDKSQSINRQITTIEEKKEYIIDDDGVIDIYACAKDIAHDLMKKYWNRKPTETDIDNVYHLVIKVNVRERKTGINENKKELLEYAFQSSSNANAMNWNYVNGVMSQLRTRGIKTIDEAYEFDIQRKSES